MRHLRFLTASLLLSSSHFLYAPKHEREEEKGCSSSLRTKSQCLNSREKHAPNLSEMTANRFEPLRTVHKDVLRQDSITLKVPPCSPYKDNLMPPKKSPDQEVEDILSGAIKELDLRSSSPEDMDEKSFCLLSSADSSFSFERPPTPFPETIESEKSDERQKKASEPETQKSPKKRHRRQKSVSFFHQP